MHKKGPGTIVDVGDQPEFGPHAGMSKFFISESNFPIDENPFPRIISIW
jgi:hypothetical protein